MGRGLRVFRVTTWNLDWFPNGNPKEAPAAEQDRRIHAAADALRAINPDVILLQEVRDYETAARLADTIKRGAYQIAICSAFKERGELGRQQVVILARESAQAPGPNHGNHCKALR
jgi:exonuclease III